MQAYSFAVLLSVILALYCQRFLHPVPLPPVLSSPLTIDRTAIIVTMRGSGPKGRQTRADLAHLDHDKKERKREQNRIAQRNYRNTPVLVPAFAELT